MQGIIFEEPTVWLFLLVTVVLGGGAVWLSGRAIARVWQTRLTLVFYTLLLALAVRFLHFALFDGTLLSLHYYTVDTLILLVIGQLGFQFERARQMTRQYHWIYERSGLFSWRAKINPAG
ncbi:MAG: DUF6867 family protein [Hyphomicrobiales bacterium]